VDIAFGREEKSFFGEGELSFQGRTIGKFHPDLVPQRHPQFGSESLAGLFPFGLPLFIADG